MPALSQVAEIWIALERSKQHSRSLATTRFTHFKEHSKDDTDRRLNCEMLQAGRALSEKIEAWQNFLHLLPPTTTRILHAQLLSRLIINGAGGVFENGGLSLDPNSGVPCIPGSAAKGVARATAMRHLAFANTAEKSPLLVQIALVFGWTDESWGDAKDKDGHSNSDFRWACGEDWETVRQTASQILLDRLGLRAKDPRRPWHSLPSFAGCIQFLPAFPTFEDPGVEKDIITSHHGEYYSGKEPKLRFAHDAEDPVPVLIPVISAAKKPLFSFALVQGKRGNPELLDAAFQWLAEALSTFGIGAKTNAGYGLFDASPELQQEMLSKLQERERSQREAAERQQRLEAEKQKREAEELKAKEQAQLREARKAATAAMTPEQRLDYEVGELSEDQFRSKVDNFSKLEPDMKNAVVRALCDARLPFWEKFKAKATKGNPARILGEIRSQAKTIQRKMP